MLPVYKSEMNETAPADINPTRPLAVLWCLQFENVELWTLTESGFSINVSVQPVMTLVVGY